MGVRERSRKPAAGTRWAKALHLDVLSTWFRMCRHCAMAAATSELCNRPPAGGDGERRREG